MMMKRIWAPWRMKYILGARETGCFLCAMLPDGNDSENLILKRGRTCFIVMNRYPYNNGHLMVCPLRHVDSLGAMTAKERAEMMELTSECVALLQKVMRPDGFNVGINLGAAAGAGLKDHIHIHIVPRWNGDTNFMPVLGQTKVIPQALHELRDELAAAMQA